jgi:hypothetical protein
MIDTIFDFHEHGTDASDAAMGCSGQCPVLSEGFTRLRLLSFDETNSSSRAPTQGHTLDHGELTMVSGYHSLAQASEPGKTHSPCARTADARFPNHCKLMA